MEMKKPIIPPKETKEYLACNEIPQLFEVNIYFESIYSLVSNDWTDVPPPR